MVNCTRCGGFMVRDSIYNIEGQYLEIQIGRCLNCGHTVDLTRLQSRHNQTQKNEEQSKTQVGSNAEKVLV